MVGWSVWNPFGHRLPDTPEISDLRVYPIKSCRGVSVKSTILTTQGLDLDRRWMLVQVRKDEPHKFVTIREQSKMTLIDTAFVGSGKELELAISIRNQPGKRIQIPARPCAQWLEENTKVDDVKIWGDVTNAYVYNDKFNTMFSDFIGKPVALVYKGPIPRLAGGNGAPEHLGREASINFPDVMPVLVANEASIVELNVWLKAQGEEAITIERFRPNIIVKGGTSDPLPAWSEDGWKTIRVRRDTEGADVSGTEPLSLELDVCMRCARCQVPNVDPETGIKHKSEPWKTIQARRQIDAGIKKPCFGMLCAPRQEGPIHVGMKFEVMETTTEHRYMTGF